VKLYARPSTRTVWVTTSFVAFHRWPYAPEETAFLRDYHRHKFGVKVTVTVGGSDREVEFFALKKELDEFAAAFLHGKRSDNSCEMFADAIAAHLAASGYTVNSVEVNEDGENGATVYYAVSPTDSDLSFSRLRDRPAK
jgi:6-pyruvoyl-tetrahydropterin synthase